MFVEKCKNIQFFIDTPSQHSTDIGILLLNPLIPFSHLSSPRCQTHFKKCQLYFVRLIKKLVEKLIKKSSLKSSWFFHSSIHHFSFKSEFLFITWLIRNLYYDKIKIVSIKLLSKGRWLMTKRSWVQTPAPYTRCM